MHDDQENVEQCTYKFQKLDSNKKRKWGNRGGCCSPPPNAEYGTQGVYSGQHASCDHMEHRLRQNRDSNRKRGEAQISLL